MNRREKATLNRDKAARLNEAWGVNAAQVRYSHDGHWYATLAHFPAALFDDHGYLLFATEEEYRSSPISIGKQVSVPKPGISAVPGYVRVLGLGSLVRKILCKRVKFRRPVLLGHNIVRFPGRAC
jgi:hypothetical protein